MTELDKLVWWAKMFQLPKIPRGKSNGYVHKYLAGFKTRQYMKDRWAAFSPEKKLAIARDKRAKAKAKGAAWLTVRHDRKDPKRILAHRYRQRLRNMLNGNYWGKSGPVEFLGCSTKFLRGYIETRFKPGMTWENRQEWDLDHIKACHWFDLTKKSEALKCFHYTNLRPEWRTRNRGRRERHEETQLALAGT